MKRPVFSWLLPLGAAMCAVLVLPGSAALAAGSHSNSHRRHVKPRPEPKPQYEALTAVDRTARTITITPMNGVNTTPRTFKVNERTEIEVEGRRATFDDLRTGMKITHGLGTDPAFVSRVVLSPAPPDPIPPTKSRRKKQQ